MLLGQARGELISIHALRVEGDLQLFLLRSRFFISIHALRVEGDLPEAPRRSKTSHFYPRPPGGGRRTDRPQAPGKAEFLSTPSGWRATSRRKRVEQSIKKFLSTPSGWRATLVVYDRVKTESDFYPRPPGGGRPFAIVKTSYYLNFYPRPPGGGRHDVGVQGRVGDNISIHALRVEGDYHLFSDCPFLIRFLSPPSGWRATIVEKSIRSTFFDFYPRPPGGGRPKNAKLLKNRHQRFLSTPSGWRATAKTDKVFICFCAKGRRICLFKTRKEKNLPVAF